MNIGLVLSGGMAKGAYQIGALQALQEYLKPEEIKYISSASVGSLNSYAFASNNLKGAAKIWRSVNNNNDKLFVASILSGNYLKDSIKQLAEHKLVCEKLYVPLFHLRERNTCYVDLKDKKNMTDYLEAAVAVFPICEPVELNGKHYYDGAVIDNIPVHPLMKHKIDYIICIYFDEYNYLFESDYFDNKIIKVNFDEEKTLLSSSIWYTKEGTERMIKEGYRKAKSIFDFVFAGGTGDVEKIYSQIEVLNSFNPKKKVRLTGDVAIANINKVAKRLTKRKFLE